MRFPPIALPASITRLVAACLSALTAVAGATPPTTAPTATDPSVNTAAVPVPKLEQDAYDWDRRHAEVLALQRTLDPEIVLIGDSITHFWGGPPAAQRVSGPQAWAATFGQRRVLNMGFGWDRTQNVLWRLEHGEFDGIRPRWIVLHIGTNNFAGTANARENTPAEVAEAIGLICKLLRARAPDSRLLVMGVLPRGRSPRNPYRAKIAALNALLAQTVGREPQVRFLDIGARFLQPNGRLPRRLMPDETHPSDAGYALWGQALHGAGIGAE